MSAPSDRLAKARAEAGFRSARAAAMHFGWAPSSYGAHENGSRGLTLDVAQIYAQAFQASPGWLLTGESEPRKAIGLPFFRRIDEDGDTLTVLGPSRLGPAAVFVNAEGYGASPVVSLDWAAVEELHAVLGDLLNGHQHGQSAAASADEGGYAA